MFVVNMKVIVTGILMASYLSISYKVKALLAGIGGMAVEFLITMTLVLSVAFSKSSELFVWSLFSLIVIQQLVQLQIEVKARIKKQHLEQEEEQQLRKSA